MQNYAVALEIKLKKFDFLWTLFALFCLLSNINFIPSAYGMKGTSKKNDSKRATPGHLDASGRTVAHWASIVGDIKKINTLIKAQPQLVKSQDKQGMSPIHHAAREGFPEIVKVLAEEHPDSLNSSDANDLTPGLYAARKGDWTTLKLIAGSNRAALDFQTKQGYTVAHVLAMHGHQKAFRIIIHEAPHLLRVATHQGQTPAHLAAHHGSAPIFRAILEKAPDTLNLLNESGLNAAHLAGKSGHREILELLVARVLNEGDYPIEQSLAAEQALLARDSENNTPTDYLQQTYGISPFILSSDGRRDLLQQLRKIERLDHTHRRLAQPALTDNAPQQDPYSAVTSRSEDLADVPVTCPEGKKALTNLFGPTQPGSDLILRLDLQKTNASLDELIQQEIQKQLNAGCISFGRNPPSRLYLDLVRTHSGHPRIKLDPIHIDFEGGKIKGHYTPQAVVVARGEPPSQEYSLYEFKPKFANTGRWIEHLECGYLRAFCSPGASLTKAIEEMETQAIQLMYRLN